jgi:diguanylate cyclase (GGDEF)-like protein
MKIRFLVYCIALFLVFSAKVNSAEFSRYLTNYSVEEGLSQSLVNQTLQDKYGYIWVATNYGLNRFDGYNFEQIPGPNNSFSSDSIVHMSALKDGRLLISTYFNGTYLLNPKTLETELLFSGKLTEVSDTVMSVRYSLEINNTLWLAIGTRLVEYNLVTKDLKIRYSMNKEEHGIRVLTYQQSSLYVGTTLGLKIFDLNTGQVEAVNHLPSDVKKTLDNDNVKSFFWDPSLGLLVGTVKGLYSFNPVTNKPMTTLIPDLNIWSMVALKKELLVATQRGLYSFDRPAKKLTHIAKYSDVNLLITNNSIRNMYVDSSGLVWLSSNIQGVFTFNPAVKKFSSFSRLSYLQLSHSVVTDYFESSPGVYWIATENGLNKLDVNEDTSQVLFASTTDKSRDGLHSIFKILPQENGEMWLWHGDGLSLFDPKTNEISYTTLSNKMNEQVAELYPYGVEKIGPHTFFFISDKGHFKLNIASNELTPLEKLDKNYKPESSAGFIPSFVNDKNIMLATTGGLVDFDHTENTYRSIFNIKDFHFNDYKYVSDWHRSHDGHVWLAVNGLGVVELDKEYRVVREITKEQGLADIRVYGINESKTGDIWVSSQSGLFKYDRASENISHYSTKQGLVSNEVHDVSKILSNGKMAFNSAAGLIMFDPQQVTQSSELAMPVKILSVGVASRESIYPFYQLAGKPFSLNYDDYGITFTFSNFNFSAQERVVYQVELSGESKVYYENYHKNSIEFTKLEPGDYEFKVSAKSPLNGAIGRMETFKFSVNYNPFLSPISLMFYAFVLMSLFVIVNMRRVRQQTMLLKAHEQVVSAKQGADLALAASNSGIWSYNQETEKTSQNRLLELGHDVPHNMLMTEYLKYIHRDDHKELVSRWTLFIAGEIQHWDVSYRLINSLGKWVWYRDLGKASLINKHSDEQNFTGTYTNINETKASEMQAQLYGQALRKMNEWLLILDDQLVPITSNSAFNKRFLNKGEALNQRTIGQVFSKKQLEQYVSKINNLEVDQKFIHEEILRVPAGFDIPVLISISAIGEKTVDNYVIVISDLSEQKKVENKLKHLASFDSLTHLANRTLIRDRIEQAITHAKEDAVALMFVDLDRFKQVNDIHGHAIGDQLLVEVAKRMNNIVGEAHSVGRQGGDEFIILLEQMSKPEDVSRYAQQLIDKLSQPYIFGNQSIHMSSSIGIAFYPYDSANGEELMQNADMAMLHAKDRGRNCYRFFTEEMNVRIKNRISLENEFVQVIQNNKLTNYYQPIVNIEAQKICGVELLLRWFNHDKMVSPDVFIPLAENIGQIVKMTELSLQKALIELKDWLINDRYLSINISALHISQPQMVENLLAILCSANVSPKQIRLEITEGVLIDDTNNAKQQLNKLKDAGFKLFLDDFGTGYSSLTYINQFPIDVIKIDQCFVREITTDKTSRAIVQTIANLAENIDSYCVVEGVEELTQVAIVKQLGCHYMQGYYFAKPMPISTLLLEETAKKIHEKLRLVSFNAHEF